MANCARISLGRSIRQGLKRQRVASVARFGPVSACPHSGDRSLITFDSSALHTFSTLATSARYVGTAQFVLNILHQCRLWSSQYSRGLHWSISELIEYQTENSWFLRSHHLRQLTLRISRCTIICTSRLSLSRSRQHSRSFVDLVWAM